MFPTDPSTSQTPDQLNPKSRYRSASLTGRVRSNSVNRDKGDLKNNLRNPANPNHDLLKAEDMKDFSVIAVYSREASRNFAKTWEQLINRTQSDSSELFGITTEQQHDSPENAIFLIQKLKFTRQSTDLEIQIKALLENRMIPHIIAVIEGPAGPDKINIEYDLESQKVTLPYVQRHFFKGADINGRPDAKQNMTFYARKDMCDAYAFVNVEIKCDENEIIKCTAIDYKAESDTLFRSLVVHIPNKFTSTKADVAATYKAFVNYAQIMAKESKPIVVTGFLGDTNFADAYFKNSVPSIGGHLSDGNTLNPQSSGAKRATNFMQSIPVIEKPSCHCVLQPATTNYVTIASDEENKVATDHPSLIHFTAHNSVIVGRNPDAISGYYFPEEKKETLNESNPNKRERESSPSAPPPRRGLSCQPMHLHLVFTLKCS